MDLRFCVRIDRDFVRWSSAAAFTWPPFVVENPTVSWKHDSGIAFYRCTSSVSLVSVMNEKIVRTVDTTTFLAS